MLSTLKLITPRKMVVSLAAVAMTVMILFGGTFAWQSISQEALNEIKGVINPGGRLHDDFNNISFDVDPDTNQALYTTRTYEKDVYVENFTSRLNEGVQVYARVRLDEYMEIGSGAGEISTANQAIPLVAGAQLADKTTWETYVPGNANEFRSYWTWKADGGSTVYMPTFNKDNTSLEADINGTWDAGFADHKDYTEGAAQTDDAAYAPTTPGGAQIIVEETHTAKKTIDGGVITMAQWLALDENSRTGNFWVWDTDGWAYWAAPIMPETATGLLLSQIQRTALPIEGEWYYGVNVVAQFITADDLGKDTETGFYDKAKWTATAKQPSDNALVLLSRIGVITDGTATLQMQRPVIEKVSAAEELLALLDAGGSVTFGGDITLDAEAVAGVGSSLYLEGHTLSAAENFAGEALLTVANGAWLDVEGGTMSAPSDGYAVRVQDGSWLHLWDGSFLGGAGVLYVAKGDVMIFGGEYRQQDPTRGQLIDWDPAGCEAGKVPVTIYGGTFFDFDPSDVNGMNLVAQGYKAVADTSGDHTVYTVVEESRAAEESEEEEPEDGEEEADEELTDEEPTEKETAGDDATETDDEAEDSAEKDAAAEDETPEQEGAVEDTSADETAEDTVDGTAPGSTASDTAPGSTASDTAPGSTASDTAPGSTASDTTPGSTASDTAPGSTAGDAAADRVDQSENGAAGNIMSGGIGGAAGT